MPVSKQRNGEKTYPLNTRVLMTALTGSLQQTTFRIGEWHPSLPTTATTTTLSLPTTTSSLPTTAATTASLPTTATTTSSLPPTAPTTTSPTTTTTSSLSIITPIPPFFLQSIVTDSIRLLFNALMSLSLSLSLSLYNACRRKLSNQTISYRNRSNIFVIFSLLLCFFSSFANAVYIQRGYYDDKAEILFVEEGTPLRVNCSSLVDLKAAIKGGNHSKFPPQNLGQAMLDLQVNWMVQRPAQARKERVADWWVSLGAKEPGYEFVDTKKTFDLNVDRIDFKGGNVVWISCECILDGIPNYDNLYKLIKAEDPKKIENKNASSSVVTVRANEKATVICEVEGGLPSINVTWTLWRRASGKIRFPDRDYSVTNVNETRIVTSERGRGGRGGGGTRAVDVLRSILTFTPDETTNLDRYLNCSVTNPFTSGPPLTTSVSLNVEYPPRLPRLVSGRGVHDDTWVRVNDDIQMDCVVDEVGNPNGEIELTNVGSGLTQKGKQKMVSLKDNVGPSLNSIDYECKVFSRLLSEPLVQRKTLKVAHGPSTVSIEGDMNFVAGKKTTLMCATYESYPASVITWELPDGRRFEGESLEYTPKEEDFNKRLACTARNPVTEKRDRNSLTVTLKYKASLDCQWASRKAEESDQQRLICTIDKYPKVSFEDVKKKMVVVEGSKVNYTIERFPNFSPNILKFAVVVKLKSFVDESARARVIFRHPDLSPQRFPIQITRFLAKGQQRKSDARSPVITSELMTWQTFLSSPGFSMMMIGFFLILALILLLFLVKFCRRSKSSSSTNSCKTSRSSAFSLNGAPISSPDARTRCLSSATSPATAVAILGNNPGAQPQHLSSGICGRGSPTSSSTSAPTDPRSESEASTPTTPLDAYPFPTLPSANSHPERPGPLFRSYSRQTSYVDSGVGTCNASRLDAKHSRANSLTSGGGVDHVRAASPNANAETPMLGPRHGDDRKHTHRSRSGSCLSSCPRTHYYFNGDVRNFQGINFPRKSLVCKETVGLGEYGKVVKGNALNINGIAGWSDVAVKMLREDADKKNKEALLVEMSIMRLVDPHQNIVKLLGCCIDTDPYMMILEFMPQGNLQDHLRKASASTPIPVTPKDLINWAYQVASGMQHLSLSHVIHRDLAARNILLGDDGVVRVADFGLARDVFGFGSYEQKSEVRLPIRWMAPEFLFKGTSSSASDIWSYGVLFWEIVTLGATPYGHMRSDVVMRWVRAGIKLEKPQHCSAALYRIMDSCWIEQPEKRPLFEDLVDKLRDFLEGDAEELVDLANFKKCLYRKLPPNMPDEKC